MIINIKVKPNSGKQEMIKINESEYKVYLKERAENNKANLELIKLLRKHFKKEDGEQVNVFDINTYKL